MIWIIIVLLMLAISYILDREIYFYEGVRLGHMCKHSYMTAGRRNMTRANMRVNYATMRCSPGRC